MITKYENDEDNLPSTAHEADELYQQWLKKEIKKIGTKKIVAVSHSIVPVPGPMKDQYYISASIISK